jgi:catechol 2,3-dioxygenase-like lactoylglutathione lyase family enzyme
VAFRGETLDTGVCHGAHFTDPDGNLLQLHHRYAPLERWAPPAGDVQRTDFVGVPVTDRPRALEFYGGALGLTRNVLAHDEWPEFEPGNVTVLPSTPQQTGVSFRPSNYSVALRVPDVAATMERLRAAGVEFAFPDVYDSGVCHMAFFADPDGNSLILHHRHAPYADGTMP